MQLRPVPDGSLPHCAVGVQQAMPVSGLGHFASSHTLGAPCDEASAPASLGFESCSLKRSSVLQPNAKRNAQQTRMRFTRSLLRNIAIERGKYSATTGQ